MQAIAYFSVNNDSDDPSYLQGAFLEFCQRFGHNAISIFSDYADGDKRTKYNEMLKFLKDSNREFLLMLSHPNSLGSDPESCVRRVLELDALGAKVICMDEDMPDPLQGIVRYWHVSGTGGPRGERIREGMMSRAIRGEGLGKPPFGYRIGKSGKLEVVQEESSTVHLIFDLYTNRQMGMRRIVKHLNERSILTRAGRNWSIVTVRDVLKNRTYVGTYTRFGMRVPRNHPALVSAQVFGQAQDMMSNRRVDRHSRPLELFLLSGLTLCSACGNKMVGVTRHMSWSRKDGSKGQGAYRYYQCQSRTNQGICRYHTWRADRLENAVLEHVRDAMSQEYSSLPDIESQSFTNYRAASAEKRLEAKFTRALLNTASGTTSMSYLRDVVYGMDEERSEKREVMDKAIDFPKDYTKKEMYKYLLAQWESLGKDVLRSILIVLIASVVVSDNSADVNLNRR
jgi:site-specific DNA recombinase